MFGFLRPDCGGYMVQGETAARRYRQVYAAMCAFQRREYGLLSSLFNSYEAIFLYHLAIESGACVPPADATPTCCRLRRDRENRWNIDIEIADFCSAYAMVLAAVKIEDDVRDNKSMLSRCTASFFKRKFANARATLDRIDQGLSSRIGRHVQEHLELEDQGEFVPMKEYVVPTARAFGEVFAGLQKVCQQRSSYDASHIDQWETIGKAVGTAIIAADCAFDYERDRARSEYNPLPSKAARTSAIHYAQSALSDAGWRCWNEDAPGVCAYVLRSTFDRLGRFIDQMAMPSQQLAVLRRGDCDCPVDACCSLCGEAACSGCGDAACSGCGDGACDSFDLPGGCCNNACTPTCDCCCYGDPCDCGTNKKKKKEPPPFVEENIGEDAVAEGEINQHGIVMMKGRLHPAKANRAIADGEKVTVLGANPFGLLVG